MDQAIRKALRDYLDNPFHRNYLALTEAVAESQVYEPYSDDFQTVNKLIKEEKYGEAFEIMRSMGFARVASPSFHWAGAWVTKKLGDQRGEYFHHVLAVKLGHQILKTGEGTEEEPFHVLWLEDEQDVLNFLEKEQISQRLVSMNGRHFDVLTCNDQSEVWFDVTIPYSHLTKTLKPSKR